MKRKTHVRIIIFLVYSIFIVSAAISAHQANDLSLLDETNSVYISNAAFEPDLSMARIDQEAKGLQRYDVRLKGEAFADLKTDTLVFFLNKLTDNAYRVELNGVIIGSEGDLEAGHSTFKGSPNHFSFDRQLLAAENDLTIYTHASYKTGIEAEGIYITDHEIGMRQANKVDLFGTYLIILGMGVLMFSVVVIVLVYYFNEDREIGYLYCALGTVFMTIFFMDYIKVVYLPYDYLVFKKLFLISLHVAVWFYILAMNQYLRSPYLKYSAAVTALSFIVMSLLVDNFVVYKQFYTYWYIVLVINLSIGLIHSLMNIREVKQAFSFAATLLYAFIYASLGVFIEYFDYTFSMNSPLVYIVIISSLPLLFGLEELMSKEEKLSYEKQRRQAEYLNSMTDNLTGIWNQRYLMQKLQETTSDSIFVMIDIDDFKDVNDRYGHAAGDYVLCEVSRFVADSVRQTDDVFRYGGDEFVAFLYGCTEEEAANKLERIRRAVEVRDFIFDEQLIQVTISVGIYQPLPGEHGAAALRRVDEQLYRSKERGKNVVSLASEKG